MLPAQTAIPARRLIEPSAPRDGGGFVRQVRLGCKQGPGARPREAGQKAPNGDGDGSSDDDDDEDDDDGDDDDDDEEEEVKTNA